MFSYWLPYISPFSYYYYYDDDDYCFIGLVSSIILIIAITIYSTY